MSGHCHCHRHRHCHCHCRFHCHCHCHCCCHCHRHRHRHRHRHHHLNSLSLSLSLLLSLSLSLWLSPSPSLSPSPCQVRQQSRNVTEPQWLISLFSIAFCGGRTDADSDAGASDNLMVGGLFKLQRGPCITNLPFIAAPADRGLWGLSGPAQGDGQSDGSHTGLLHQKIVLQVYSALTRTNSPPSVFRSHKN